MKFVLYFFLLELHFKFINLNNVKFLKLFKMRIYNYQQIVTQKICEREKLAKERNQKILAEFDHVKKTLVSMERKSRSLKNAKVRNFLV